MFGILVGTAAMRTHCTSNTADAAAGTRRLTRMANIIAWLPLIVLTLKKAV